MWLNLCDELLINLTNQMQCTYEEYLVTSLKQGVRCQACSSQYLVPTIVLTRIKRVNCSEKLVRYLLVGMHFLCFAPMILRDMFFEIAVQVRISYDTQGRYYEYDNDKQVILCTLCNEYTRMYCTRTLYVAVRYFRSYLIPIHNTYVGIRQVHLVRVRFRYVCNTIPIRTYSYVIMILFYMQQVHTYVCTYIACVPSLYRIVCSYIRYIPNILRTYYLATQYVRMVYRIRIGTYSQSYLIILPLYSPRASPIQAVILSCD